MAVPSTDVAGSLLGPGSLVIDRIEIHAVRVPLPRPFVGSNYSMESRCTIVTRLTTADGVVAEVYNGDTDAEQARIVGIVHDELPPGSWVGARPTPRDAGERWSRPRTTSSATAGLPSRPSRASTPPSGMPSGGPWGSPSTGCGGACSEDLPVSMIGGYYHLDRTELAEFAARSALYEEGPVVQ